MAYKKFLLASLLMASSFGFAAGTTPQTFTLDGQLYATGTTTPLLDATAVIKVQILDPSLTCLLYEQQHTVDTLSSNGYFNVEVGSDTGAIPPRTGLDPGRTMLQVYQNTSPITAANAPSQTCAGGVYTPANGHKRIVRVIVTPTATGTEDTLSPDIVMNSMPMAKVAESIQGIVPASLLQVDTSGTTQLTQANLAAAFTGTAYTNLQAVLAGGAGAATSVNASAGTVGAPSISFSGDTDTGLYSVGANQIGVTTGGVQRFIVDASGISSGTTGGGVLTSAAGTAALPALSFAGDLDTGWWRPAANTMAASTGGVEQMRITSAGYVGIANTTPGSELDVKGTLRLTGATSGYIGLRAPATVTTPVTFTLPDGDSSPGYVLATNGSGTLSWAAPGGAASTTGLALGTVTAPSLSFSGDLNTGIWSPGAETVAVSTSGAERIRITSTGYVGIGTTAPAAPLEIVNTSAGAGLKVVSSGGLVMVDVNENSNNRQVSLSDGSTTGMTIGPNPDGIVMNANNDSPVKIHPNATGASAASVLTIGSIKTVFINPSSAIGIGTTSPVAKLDLVGDMRFNGATSGYVGFQAPATVTTPVTFTLPNGDGTANQVLKTSGSGILSWTSVSSGTTGLALGTVAAPSISFSGDLDTGIWSPAAETVAISTSGAERIRITPTGYVGIGTTTPVVPLTVDTGTNSPIKIVNTIDNPAHYLLLGRYNYLNAFSDTYETLNLYYDGNLNKGLYFIYGTRQSDPLDAGYPAKLTFSRRGGLDVMTLDQSGNVGIGVTSPGSKLDVKGTIRLSGSTSGYVGFAPAAVAGSTTYTLPSADGTVGQVLGTDGTGILSWVSAGGTTGLALGTVTAPSISFSGDLNTGIWSPAAETVAISTSGSEKIRITPTGYVGIGTSDPSRQLYLSTASAGLVYQIGLENHQGAGATGILFNVDGNGSNGPAPQRGKGGLVYESTDGWSRGRFMFLQNSAADLSVASLSDVVFSIANDGEVKAVKSVDGGLGGRLIISNPYDNSYGVTHSALFMDAQKKAGILKVTTSNWGVGDLYFVQNNVTDSSTYSLNNPAMVIKSDGNIGIGTTAPGAKLDVKDTIRISGSTSGYVGLKAAAAAGSTTYTLPAADGTVGQVLTTDGTGILSWATAGGGGGTTGLALGSVTVPSISFSGDLNTGIWSPAAETIAISTSGSEKIRITPTGYVGVGQTTPTSLLHIKNNDGVTRSPSMINLENAVGNAVITFPYGGNINNGYDGMQLNTNGDYLRFAAQTYNFSGHVINLSHSSDSDVLIHSAANGGKKFTIQSPGHLDFNTYNGSFDTRVRISLSGDLGVGTTAPTQRLQVGSSGDGSVAIANAWNTFSDARLKNIISRIPNAISIVDQMNGYYYLWKDGIDQSRQVGVIAQEVEKVLPELVKKDINGVLSVDYPKLTAVLIEANKELNNKLMKQELEISTIKSYLCAKDPKFCK